MHRKLDEYLFGVSERLDALPILRRNEELREMRQHLLNAVIANQETGLSEDEAVDISIKHYGPSDEIASKLIWAWRRGDKREKALGVWGGAACTLVILCVFTFISPPISYALNALSNILDAVVAYLWAPHVLAPNPGNQTSWLAATLEAVMTFGVISIPGYVTGFLFPKRGMVGAVVGTLAFLIIMLMPVIHTQPHVLDDFRWGNLILMIALMVLQSGVGAWRRTRYGRGRWRYAN